MGGSNHVLQACPWIISCLTPDFLMAPRCAKESAYATEDEQNFNVTLVDEVMQLAMPAAMKSEASSVVSLMPPITGPRHLLDPTFAAEVLRGESVLCPCHANLAWASPQPTPRLSKFQPVATGLEVSPPEHGPPLASPGLQHFLPDVAADRSGRWVAWREDEAFTPNLEQFLPRIALNSSLDKCGEGGEVLADSPFSSHGELTPRLGLFMPG